MEGKTKKIVYWIGGILAFAGIATGVGIYVKRQTDLLLDFCYNITNFKFIKIDSTGISISFILNIKNQSGISVNIKKYNFDILLNGIKLANINSSQAQTWQKNAVSPIAINVNVKWKDLKEVNFNTVSQMVVFYFSDKSKLVLKIAGQISAEALKIPVNDYPVTMSFTIAELLAPSSTASTCKI